jgi:hypothetical protein
VQLVLTRQQAGKGPQVDHPASVGRRRAHPASRARQPRSGVPWAAAQYPGRQ